MPRGVAGQVGHQGVALLLRFLRAVGPGAGVDLVHDDELRRLRDEGAPARLDFGVVDGDDGVRVILPDAAVVGHGAVEGARGGRADHDGLDAELVAEFLGPLVAEVGRAEHGETADLRAFDQLLGDQQGFHGLADAHVVGDHEPHGPALPERHDERDELVGSRPERQLAEAAEGSAGFAERKPRRVEKDAPVRQAPELAFVRQRELGALEPRVEAERQIDRQGLLDAAAERAGHE